MTRYLCELYGSRNGGRIEKVASMIITNEALKEALRDDPNLVHCFRDLTECSTASIPTFELRYPVGDHSTIPPLRDDRFEATLLEPLWGVAEEAEGQCDGLLNDDNTWSPDAVLRIFDQGRRLDCTRDALPNNHVAVRALLQEYFLGSTRVEKPCEYVKRRLADEAEHRR